MNRVQIPVTAYIHLNTNALVKGMTLILPAFHNSISSNLDQSLITLAQYNTRMSQKFCNILVM